MRNNNSRNRRGQGAYGTPNQTLNLATRKITAVKRQLNGAVLRGSPDPTITVDRPWNQVTVSFTVTNGGNVSVAAINSAFGVQVGAGTLTPALEFRFREVRVWETSGANVGLSIFDLIQSDVDPYRTAHDEPGRNHWAHCGLMWGSADQASVFPGASTTNIFTVTSSTTGITAVVHVNLLWRFAGTPAPTVAAQISC